MGRTKPACLGLALLLLSAALSAIPSPPPTLVLGSIPPNFLAPIDSTFDLCFDPRDPHRIAIAGIDVNPDTSENIERLICGPRDAPNAAWQLGKGFFIQPGGVAIDDQGRTTVSWSDAATSYTRVLQLCVPGGPLGNPTPLPNLFQLNLINGSDGVTGAGVRVNPNDRLAGISMLLPTAPSKPVSLTAADPLIHDTNPRLVYNQMLKAYRTAYARYCDACAPPANNEEQILVAPASLAGKATGGPVDFTYAFTKVAFQPDAAILPSGPYGLIFTSNPDAAGIDTEIGAIIQRGLNLPTPNPLNAASAPTGLQYVPNLLTAPAGNAQHTGPAIAVGGADFFVAAAVAVEPPNNDRRVKVTTFDANGLKGAVKTIAFPRSSTWPNTVRIATGYENAFYVAARDYLDHSYDGIYKIPFTMPRPCAPSDAVLCLGNGRFRVEATFKTANGDPSPAHGVTLTNDTGYFHFGDPNNVEVLLKVLNGCGLGGNFWVFAAGLTNVLTSLTVSDAQNGHFVNLLNPQGTPFQPYQNTSALACASTGESVGETFDPDQEAALPASEPGSVYADLAADRARAPVGTCVGTATTLCLNQGRFAVSATYTTAQGQSGAAHVGGITPDTGYLWFFDLNNVEVVLKVLNGCTINSKYWVFAGGLTNVKVVLTVRDTLKGVTKTFTNPQGTPFKPIQDSGAFATCP